VRQTPLSCRRYVGFTAVAAALTALCGCEPVEPTTTGEPDPPRVEPLPLQQSRAYPETATGLFLSLADFEDIPGGPDGRRQVGRFRIASSRPGAATRFVVNITRTGTGAMEVILPPGSALVFDLSEINDFTGYTLLSIALYSRAIRDDLRVTVATDKLAWTSPRVLLRQEWNNVLVDIRRLARQPGFDITSIRTIRLAFGGAIRPVRLNLDDIMLIDNRRQIEPTPPGIKLLKAGQDLSLSLPLRRDPVKITFGRDGLWRLDADQAVVQLAGPGKKLPSGPTEQLDLMGFGRIGDLKIIEQNALRVRLVNTWYFPARAGAWASLAVRRITWTYSFYFDGRWITHVELNNAGGREIGRVRIWPAQEVAWAGASVARQFTTARFVGPVGRWNYLTAPPSVSRKAIETGYLRPGAVKLTLGDKDAFAPGDVNRDRFDESQGCYFLKARRGNCRFTLVPPIGGVLNPLFRVAGHWAGKVKVSSEGLAIRDVVRLADGSALFALKDRISRPIAVEVTGRPASFQD